jgi:pyridoxal phosphate enzyme (YggS family)
MLIGPQNLVVTVNQVRSRIENAAKAASRDPASITLVAVSKTQSAESVRGAATAGVTDFGENYVQEALRKMDQLEGMPLHWHFIGALQSNKTRAVAERFEWVHSIDRLGLAERLSRQRPYHAAPLNVCIQVALVQETTKGGVVPANLAALAHEIAALPRLKLRGLMCLPPANPDTAAQRAVFRRLAELAEELKGQGLELDTLSMGMSADFESAIVEGATHVRIGTALFGERRSESGATT